MKFIDYLPMATAICFAHTFQDIVQWKKYVRLALLSILIINVPVSVYLSYRDLHGSDNDEISDEEFEMVGGYLKENTEQLETVVVPWNDFTIYFFYNDHNSYPVGMTPYYMLMYDDKAFTAFYYLFSGKLNDPENALPMFFNSRSNSRISIRARGSSPLAGSSNMSTSGS